MTEPTASGPTAFWLRGELLASRLESDTPLPAVLRWVDLDRELLVAGGAFRPGMVDLPSTFVWRLHEWRVAGIRPIVATVSLRTAPADESETREAREAALELDTLTGGTLDALRVTLSPYDPVVVGTGVPAAPHSADACGTLPTAPLDSTVRRRILGAMLGLAVGDSLGAPVENWPAEKIRRVHGEFRDYVSGRGWGPGQPTRETTFALIWLRELASGRSVHRPADRDRIGDLLGRWVAGRPRDFGHLTRGVLREYRTRPPVVASRMMWESAKRLPEFNAALSRACAVAAALPDADGLRHASVLSASAMTHPAPVCLASASAVGHGLAAAIRGEDPFRAARSVTFDDRVAAAMDAVAADWRPGREDWNGHQRGHPLKTLQAALWCAASPDSFEETLLRLVHEGGDADTHAAIAGAFLGARDGPGAIPPRWLDRLKVRSTIVRLVETLRDEGSRSKGEIDPLS